MDMETIWMNITHTQKLWILRECGWRTAYGQPTKLAKSASKRPWDSLSPAMQNVLVWHATAGLISL